jgi:hypothetical protein
MNDLSCQSSVCFGTTPCRSPPDVYAEHSPKDTNARVRRCVGSCQQLTVSIRGTRTFRPAVCAMDYASTFPDEIASSISPRYGFDRVMQSSFVRRHICLTFRSSWLDSLATGTFAPRFWVPRSGLKFHFKIWDADALPAMH